MINQSEAKKSILIPISKARPGMITSRDIYSKNDQLVLNKDIRLDVNSIAKLMLYSIDRIAVYEEEKENTAQNTYDSYTAKIRETVEFREFAKQYDKTLDTLRDALRKITDGDFKKEEERLTKAIDSIVQTSASKIQVFNMLHCIRDYDEPTYMHSVNVSIICNVFAEWMNMNEQDKKALTLAGMLHDIGKTAIPLNLLNKPSQLTENEFDYLKRHAQIGYDMIKDQDIDERVKLAVLQHHERYEGSGYPNGIKGDEIEDFAMLVAIADVYDAMTSDRIYRPRICPFDVIGDFEFASKFKFSPEYLVPILEQIAQTYIHHTVKLSDDNKGEIILVNKQELSKPIVKVENNFIDLAKKRDIKITEVF